MTLKKIARTTIGSVLFILYGVQMLLGKEKILKASAGHNTITYAVLVPEEEDRNGDVISDNEIIKTAHEFMSNLQAKSVNFNHEDGTDTQDVIFVESFVAPAEIPLENGKVIKKGTWMVGFKFLSDTLFKKVLT